jgi:hypothetical protein
MIRADEIVLNRAILGRAQAVKSARFANKRGKHKRHYWIAAEHFLKFYESPRGYQRSLSGPAARCRDVRARRCGRGRQALAIRVSLQQHNNLRFRRGGGC